MQIITITNPATGERLATYDVMSDERVAEILTAADEAFAKWRAISHADRAPFLHAIADELRSAASECADLMTAETGKLRRDGLREMELCAAIFDYTAAQGPIVLADEERTHSGGEGRAIVTYSPLGVIYSVQPWNFPFYQPVRVLAANLMAGNAVVLKHAAICTGSALKLAEICRSAGLPDGLFDVLLIDHDQSDTVIADPIVRGVTMTGSDDAGSHIGSVAGRHLKKTVLELGSNDAYLVLSDADIELAVETSIKGRLYNNGQTCVAAKRFIVTDAVHDRFVEAFVDGMASVIMGDPSDDDTQLGPVSSREQFDTLVDQVTTSIDRGATLACGGDPDHDRDGFWYPATVLTDVAPGMPAYDDELFGPVASVIRATDDADAMRIANDSRYGLGGGIFSADTERAVELARTEFDTGMVRINSFGAADPNLPFGGVKDSGYGREHGGFGMREFVNVKAVYLP